MTSPKRQKQGKRGRPKKPVVPRHQPAAADSPATTATAMAGQLAAIQAKASQGKHLANHESRLLRDAWLQDMREHLWPSLEAAAADLGISPSTLRNHAEAGCPSIEPHSPIPKAPVLRWLLQRAHDHGGAPTANKDSLEEVSLRIQTAKAAKLERTLIAEAEDLATQGVITRIAQVRHHMLHVLPAVVIEACAAHPDRSDQEAAISRAIDQALAIASATTTPTEPPKDSTP